MNIQINLCQSNRKIPVVICAIALFLGGVLHGMSQTQTGPDQDVDPFYTRILTQAETLYATGDYREAIKKFEVAAFGLSRDKNLHAKVRLYLALCQFQLKEYEASDEQLRSAVDDLGLESISSEVLGLPPPVKEDVENLLVRFRLKERETTEKPAVQRPIQTIPKKTATKRTTQPASKKPSRTSVTQKREQDTALRLENEIKNTPRNPALYYDLLRVYTDREDTKAAKKTLKKLVLYNPYESRGLLLLGKLLYAERDFKECEKTLERILTISGRRELPPEVLLDTQAYLILASYYMGDQKDARTRAMTWRASLEDQLNTLGLGDRERQRLQALFRQYLRMTQEEQDQAAIDDFKDQIRRNPYRPAPYYELYTLYANQMNLKEAKATLKKLVKNNPREMYGYQMLVKFEYVQKNYNDSITYCRKILESTDQTNVSHEIVVSTLIYAVLCNYRINRITTARSLTEILESLALAEEISAALQEDTLEDTWTEAMRVIRQSS